MFAAADANKPIPHNVSYYLKCMLGGIIACGSTHSAITPLDLVKCNIQANPGKYKGIFDGFKVIGKTKGFGPRGGLYLGFFPTLCGYACQGCFKFGFYEIFKDLYSKMVGEEKAFRHRTLLYLCASFSAEFCADVFLCPFEAIKVRMQTAPAEAKFPTKLGEGWNQIKSAEGLNGLYKGLVPLWFRQIPYTMMKFTVFESTVELFYKYVFTKGKSNYSKPFQLGVTFLSGYIAGIFCAIVSHPADVIVSVLNKNPGTSIGVVCKQLGWKGLWSGLVARIFMIGTLTAFQWWIYDTFKTACGLGTTGGH